MSKSILQKDYTRCFICKQNPCGDPLDKHHVFGGALRKKSEHYGLTIYVHHEKCHVFGKYSAGKGFRPKESHEAVRLVGRGLPKSIL